MAQGVVQTQLNHPTPAQQRQEKTVDISPTSPMELEAIRKRAMKAQEVARKMMATYWAPFVRMYSRNPKMKVALTAGVPRTDGKTTWLRVPIELGDDTPHDKKLCGRRDRTKGWTMFCPACDIFDDAVCTITHEGGHCTEGSFDEVSDYELQQIIVRAIQAEATNSRRLALVVKRVEAQINFVTNYMSAAALVSPFLPFIVNVVEDVWVNNRIMEYRPGTKRQFVAKYWRVFEKGHEDFFGENQKWIDRPLNSQIAIGVLCMGSGVNLEGKLHPKVVFDLTTDDEINSLVGEIDQSYTAEHRYKLAIRFLEAFRRLGYCISEDDPEPPPPQDGDGVKDQDAQEAGETSDSDETDDDSSDGSEEDDADAEGSGGAADSDDEEEDSDNTGATGGKDQDSPADSQGGDDSQEGQSPWEDDIDQSDPGFPSDADFGTPEDAQKDFEQFGQHDKDSDDYTPTPQEAEEQQEMERAVNQGEHFEKSSLTISGLDVVTFDKPYGAFNQSLPHTINIPPSILNPALMKSRITFTNNKKGKRQRDLETGTRLDGQVLARRLLVGDNRVFEKRSRPGKRDYFVCIGMDVSGSTGGNTIELEKECTYAQVEMLSKLGIACSVYAHTGTRDRVLIHEIKAMHEPWGEKQKEAFSTLGAFSCNLDGHTMEYYRKVLDRSTATDRIILYYTDGAMPNMNFEEELDVLQKEIRLCRRKGYYLLGVGIRNDDPLAHGLDMVRLDQIGDIPRVVEALRERLV